MRSQVNPFGPSDLELRRRAEFAALVAAGKTQHGKVRRVSATRRALEAFERFRAEAKARGERVRWDEALAVFERQDPKAARIVRATVEAQRRAASTKGRARDRALEGEAKRKRIQQINAAGTRRRVRQFQRQEFACVVCGVRWCNRPLAGRGLQRTRYCSDPCKSKAWKAGSQNRRKHHG